jgi:hypothetical protein
VDDAPPSDPQRVADSPVAPYVTVHVTPEEEQPAPTDETRTTQPPRSAAIFIDA